MADAAPSSSSSSSADSYSVAAAAAKSLEEENNTIDIKRENEISLYRPRTFSDVLSVEGTRNCSHWLKFETQYEGIGISDAVNMARPRIFF
ncbi:hypothetical protein BVRB_5g107080 [Beta vulgaris subsp. vulgaris]|nr:hypothetical protein BVRB_5g107080 [Beta vulgaris subsp. vulgaris]